MAKRVTEADVAKASAQVFGRAPRERDAAEQQIDEATAQAFGRAPKRDPLTEAVHRTLSGQKPLTLAEAETEVSLARAFGRTPNPEAVKAVERLNEVRAEERDQYPWRAAATAGMRDQLIAAEEHLTALVSKARGQTKDSARRTVENRLREAWTTAHGSDHDRMAAVVEAAQKDFRHFTAVAEVALGKVSGGGR